MKKLIGLILLSVIGCCASADDSAANERSQALRGSYCTYAAPPRLEDKRVDVERLVAELLALHANTYRWVFVPGETNLQDFKKFLPLARAQNLRVWVTVNHYKAATPEFAKNYGPLCDGIMFPYRDESGGANFTNSVHLESEIKVLRERFSPSCPIIVGVFASRHSKLGISAPDYVERVMRAAQPRADGVSVYRHPNRTADPEKYEIVKRLFTAWTAPK